MIIDCISDLHGYYPQLEGGDLLIVAGDLTARDTIQDCDRFFDWFALQQYTKKVYIAGNHDNLIQNGKYSTPKYCDATYLCDSGTEFSYHIDGFPEEDEGFLASGKRTLKIWGSPWTKTFKGMNPRCKAFTCDTEEELAQKWALIPDDIDILVTHSPPYGILDEVRRYGPFSHERNESVGSKSLLERVQQVKPKFVFYGHIHECGLKYTTENGILFVNASYVNEDYVSRKGYIRCHVQNSSFTACVIQEQKK